MDRLFILAHPNLRCQNGNDRNRNEGARPIIHNFLKPKWCPAFPDFAREVLTAAVRSYDEIQNDLRKILILNLFIAKLIVIYKKIAAVFIDLINKTTGEMVVCISPGRRNIGLVSHQEVRNH